MNGLQACEFEILKELVCVFEKLNISYFLIGGSALGAVKYKGFIPWDDDIDIGIFRDDYENFLKEGQALLPKHLFLQNFKTDENFSLIYSKVRNSKTTYIETGSAHMKINHGVFIDIFPLDGYPKEKKEQMKLANKKRKYTLIGNCGFNYERSPKEALLVKAMRLLRVDKRTKKALKKYEEMICRFKTEDSDIICNYGNWKGEREYVPREYYGKGILAEFEGLRVRVPEMYDEYLTQKYGDWRADPPETEQQGHHFCTACDLTKPYTHYV